MLTMAKASVWARIDLESGLFFWFSMALHGGQTFRTGRGNGVSYLQYQKRGQNRWTMNVSLRNLRYMSWQALWRRGREKNTRFTTSCAPRHSVSPVWRTLFTTGWPESFSKTRQTNTKSFAPAWPLNPAVIFIMLPDFARQYHQPSLHRFPWQMNFRLWTFLCNILFSSISSRALTKDVYHETNLSFVLIQSTPA